MLNKNSYSDPEPIIPAAASPFLLSFQRGQSIGV
jgi:hypothetical protein